MDLKHLVSVLALSWLASGVTVLADERPEAESPDRPRIGLVLGGGGARGAAHIAVLAELERRRVPIDAIAGTSMGAVVGSLYAAGMTPGELETLVDSIDWEDAFTDSPGRPDLSFRRKKDDEAYPVKLELGVSDGEVLTPRGLIQGQKLHLILREELLHVSHIEEFDELPIPFRAVASDIASGELHVMSRGDLALAARASMSAPGIFAPVVVGERTLVDGGLVGNVPVDVVRQMDVDVVIAVDVEFPLYEPSLLESALQVTEQMLTILIHKETVRQLATLGDQDVLIRPQLGIYASTNFADIGDVIEPGRAATAAAGDRLDALALSPDDYEAFRASRRLPPGQWTTVDFVRVVDDSPLSPAVLQSRLETSAGDPLDVRRLEKDVERLYGLNYYEYVGYRLIEDDGRTGVEFHTRTKSWGPNFLKFGLSLEDDFEGSTAFNVAARLTATGLNALGAEWRNDVQLGTNPRFETEFYQPLSFDSRFFAAPRITLEQDNFNAFAGPDRLARYRVSEVGAGLDFGRTLGYWGEIRTGVFRGAGDARVKVGDPSLQSIDFDAGGVLARFRVDTLDDALIPHEGIRADVEWLMSRPGIGAADKFDTVEVSLDKVWTWGSERRNTIQLGLEYGTTLDSVNLIQHYFPLGGFLRLSGLERGGIAGPHKGLGRIVYYRRTGDGGGGVFEIPFYVGGSIETGNAWQRRSDISFESLIVNGSLFAGVDTYLGPLFIAAGFSEQGESSFYLFFGNPTP